MAEASPRSGFSGGVMRATIVIVLAAAAPALPVDSDGDGREDAVEGVVDSDGDGLADFADDDDDGDGIPTLDEEINAASFGDDIDGDGLVAALDDDENQNGINDGVDGVLDDDEDGVPNYLDPAFGDDDDDDGLPASVELELGLSPLFSDSDKDGFGDGLEGLVDRDSDGIIDSLDFDSDNDSVPDVEERGAFRLNVDEDADAIRTNVEYAFALRFGKDIDGDGLVNWLDTDADGDGKDDVSEGFGDVDADGIAAFLDPDDSSGPDFDDDGDGLNNSVEFARGSSPLVSDTDGDGVLDLLELDADSDGDGLKDSADGDSDNDGVRDGDERDEDTDGDGLVNRADFDDDGDGIPTATERADVYRFLPALGLKDADLDVDGDRVAAWLDTDSDDDGVLDAALGRFDDDSDGIPNYLDLDDADGEAGDFDGDGLTNRQERMRGSDPFLADTDGDGRPDALETAGRVDTDGDGVFDIRDADSDNDGLSDGDEDDFDDDNDGLPSFRDRDSDNDGLGDDLEGLADFDGDDLIDARDDDDDGDGIATALEHKDGAVFDTDGDGDFDHLDFDADNDGRSDRVEGVGDVDGDGVLNFRDPSDLVVGLDLRDRLPDVDVDAPGAPVVDDGNCIASGSCVPTGGGCMATPVAPGLLAFVFLAAARRRRR
jgi:hypothetical protein